MQTIRFRRKLGATRGFTLVENLVAMGIVALAFSALSALNSQCLYLLNSGRCAVFAQQALQDRMEQLSKSSWFNLTSASYIQNSILNTATTNGASLGQPTETIIVDTYPTTSGTNTIQVTRSGSTATITHNNTSITGSDPG